MHSKSGECAKTELDLFSVPPTQVSLEKGLWVDQQPVTSVSDGGPITFLCPGTEDYVDLSKTILVVRAKVTKANGNDLDADEHVGIVNNFLHSLFKQVERKTSDASDRNVCLPCLLGNAPQLWSCGKRVSTDGRHVLQRYARQDGRCRPDDWSGS